MKHWYIKLTVSLLLFLGVGILWFLLVYSRAASSGTSFKNGYPFGPQMQTNAVTIRDGKFEPDNIVVKRGSTIIWTNNDGAAHSIVFDRPYSNSGVLQDQGNYSLGMDADGTFTYHCGIYPGYVGKVTVVN